MLVHFCHSQPQLTEIKEFGENPGNLKMFMHIPLETDSLNQKPLVIALHGCSQKSKDLASITDWNKLADQNDFVMLYPEQKLMNNMSGCFNWFRLEDISINSGELLSLKNMIDYAISHYHIDTSLIYVYGLSAGAAMAVAMMAVYPNYFKAGAIFAGAPYKIATNTKEAIIAMNNTINKSPEEWASLVPSGNTSDTFPKLILYHGNQDKIVNIQNSYELIDQWSALMQIDTIPDHIDTNYQSPNVTRIVYTDSANVEKVIFYKILNIGHAVAVDPDSEPQQGGKTDLFARDIGFFSTYYVAKELGLIR